jgi:hypothetical protein
MLFTKSALAIALAATTTAVNAESLRGPVVQSTLDQIPSPDVHCNKKSHDSSNCSGVKSSNGDHCVWCQVKKNEGACLSQNDADYAMNLFNIPCPEYAQLLEAQKEEKKLTIDTPDFMCMLATIGGEQACDQISASDGSNCVWCTGSHAPSACLSTKDAVFADDKFGLSCPSVNIEDVITEEVEVSDQPDIDPGMFDLKCFMAAWNAENAEEACGTTEADDGSKCVWCQTEGDSMGACLHSKQAEIADGKYGLSCPSEKVATYIDTDRD